MKRALALLGLLVFAAPAAGQNPALNGAAKGRELLAAGKYAASLPFFQRELDQAEAKLGPDNPAVAAEINDLAEANRLAGRDKAAEALYLRAIDLDEQAHGKDAEGLATSLNNLALVYRKQGRLDEAVRLHTRSLNLLQDTLGRDDPRVAMSLHNLAAVYRLQGRIDEARPLQERAVEVADKALDRQDPDAIRIHAALASLGKPPRAAAAPAAVPDPPVPRVAGKGALPPPPMVEAAAPLPSTAPTAASAGDGFAVQVAAVPQLDQVAGEWRRLVRRFPDLATLELQPAQAVEVAGKGTFYRVIAGPLASKSAVQSLCARLKKAGASCRLAKP